MSSLSIITAHAGAACFDECRASWGTSVPVIVADGEQGMLPAYEKAWRACPSDILAFFHTDLLITEPDWHLRVLTEFNDPMVGLVGFGGSPQHGDSEMYRKPYELVQLARGRYYSNAEDAEIHGEQFTGSMDVAVLDGLALIVRRDLLERLDGWPINNIKFHCYDYWLCCATRRMGYNIRLVGVKFLHLGGRTTVALKKGDPVGNHEASHQWIYSEFADVLPFRAEQR